MFYQKKVKNKYQISRSDPISWCYLCGRTDQPLTRDHVIPKCLFTEPRPQNLITLPCCIDCQQQYQKDEEFFRTFVSTAIDLEDNPNAMQIWETALRGLERKPGLLKWITSRVFTVDIVSEAGIWLEKGMAIKIPEDRINKVLKKIALGLFCYHLGFRVPDNFKTKVLFQPEEIARDPKKCQKISELIKSAKYARAYKDICSYGGVVAKDTYSSIWLMSFYRSVPAIVIFRSSGGFNSPS